MAGRVQVVPDEPHERVFGRVAAVDVAKKSGVVCTRLPDSAGRQVARWWAVTATVSEVSGLAAELAGAGIEKVTLESTSDYWRIWFYLFEAAGLDVQLVNASQARQLSGRPKTDLKDAMWLARLTEMGLLRPSFVPPAGIRALRFYTRTRTRLVQDRTRCWQRIEKLLEDALIKVSSVASKMTTLSVRDMLEALIAGERDPQVLAGLARSRMKAKHDALVQALEGRFEDHHGEIVRMLLDQIDHLVSWAGLCPRTIQSGTRTKQGKKPGNTYLRGYLGQAAAGAAGTATFLGERHARIARRRGPARAQVAVARSIAVIIWHLLNDRDARYHDLGPDWHQRHTDKNKKTRNYIRQLEALGYTVTLTQTAA